MRPLLVNFQEVKRVQLHARQRCHWYTGRGAPPGDDPRFVCVLPVGFRCVFSYTQVAKTLFRHLSVSLADAPRNRRPNPQQVATIADAFGFTGWRLGGKYPFDWGVAFEGLAVVVAQAVEPDDV